MRGLTLSLIIAFSADNGVPHAGLFQVNIDQPALVASR